MILQSRRVTKLFGLLVLSMVLFGCASAPTATPLPPATLAKSGTIRINNPTSPSLLDVPYLMALDTLRAQGYTIDLKQYARFDLVAPAMAQGELDIASSALQTMWAAVAKGAPVKMIVSRFRSPYRLVAQQSIKSCAELNGKNMGVGSTSGVNHFMLVQNFAKNCPGTTPNEIVLSATANRIPALVGGQVDAAMLEVDDTFELERQAPGKFHTLVNFAEQEPNLEVSGVFVQNEFAAKNPISVQDFVRALVQAQRAVQDKTILQQAIVKYFGMESVKAQQAADAYLALGVWDENGGVNAERAQYTFDFMKQAKIVPADASLNQFVELSYLDTALADIGHK